MDKITVIVNGKPLEIHANSSAADATKALGMWEQSLVAELDGLILSKDEMEAVAKENAKINNIKNAEFYHDDATSFIHYLNNKKQKLDVIFMDPPRDGSTQSFIQAVFAIKPKKVVYVSCEPSSLARDLKILKEQYDVVKIQPVDMFPHTHHVESVVLLELKK